MASLQVLLVVVVVLVGHEVVDEVVSITHEVLPLVAVMVVVVLREMILIVLFDLVMVVMVEVVEGVIRVVSVPELFSKIPDLIVLPEFGVDVVHGGADWVDQVVGKGQCALNCSKIISAEGVYSGHYRILSDCEKERIAAFFRFFVS